MDVPNSGRRRVLSSLAEASEPPMELPEPSPPSRMYACLLENPNKFLYHLPPKFSYDIFFTAPLYLKNKEMHQRLFTVNIHADGPGEVNEEPLKPFWTGKLPELYSFAALGSHVYCFGGRTSPTDTNGIREVCKIQVLPYIPKDAKWVSASPMISSRVDPFVSVVGSKIFVCNSSYYKFAPSDPDNGHWAELFDPVNGKSEYIPDPPFPARAVISVSAAPEKPEILLVAFHERHSVCQFCLYNVESRSWKMLPPVFSSLHHEKWRVKVRTVGNTLYYVDRMDLIAYNLELDMLLEASLWDLGFFEDDMDFCPGSICQFIHLEKQRFCFLNVVFEDYLHCVVADVFHMPEKKALGISVVWQHKYPTERVSPEWGPPICLSSLVALRKGAEHGLIC
jgi:hypothetical protein